MTDVVEINSIEALRSYHLAWTALHAETPRATFFQTFEWLENYWQHCGGHQRLRVLIVRASGRPIGILPLVERVESSRLGPVRVLTYPLDNWGTWYGPIGPNQTATLALAMKHLAAQPRTWDVFAPRWTAHDTTDRGCTEHAMQIAGMTPAVEKQGSTSVIEFDRFTNHQSQSDGGWNAYLQSRTKKVRHELLRQRRQLDKQGKVAFHRFRPEPHRCGDGDPHWEVYEDCLAVAEKSWQATSKSGNTLCHGSVAELLADAHDVAARLGMLDMCLLTVGGKPAAYYYAYHCDGRIFGLRTGFDPSIPGGAGSVLLGRLIEDSFARGDKRLDLGVGPEAYKRRLRTSVETSSQLTHIARGAWRPQALRVAKKIVRRLGRAS